MPEEKLRIGYAGTLMAHRPGRGDQGGKSFFGRLKDWFWTYRIDSVQAYTRSGYFLLKGVQRFREKYPELAPGLEVNLWGLIEEGNKAQVKEFGLEENVLIEGYFSKQESADKIAACDLLFLPLETGDDPLYIPGKIFDYIRTGKPVLVLGQRSDCTDILARAGLGILVDPFDADAIADELARLLNEKNSLAEKHKVDWGYVETHFHFRNLSRQLADLFKEVAAE